MPNIGVGNEQQIAWNRSPLYKPLLLANCCVGYHVDASSRPVQKYADTKKGGSNAPICASTLRDRAIIWLIRCTPTKRPFSGGEKGVDRRPPLVEYSALATYPTEGPPQRPSFTGN
ncbi:unnamed protein product [Nezara viridula]|uniref:Uncharacterized protein n=1 Tax=Nezara viridula TaxID=85310 RepID=A0A9P0H631_NEZVI|nr:unnamed protein product [Nezara viridula]